jgi:hypothetical protein
MNTPGKADGVVRTYFDGELSLERTDLVFRHAGELKIDLFYISTFFGGSDPSWAPPKDTYITYDDFQVVSDPESSPYPQALYELSATNGRLGPDGKFTIRADLSASLGGGELNYSVYGPETPLAKARNAPDAEAQGSWTYYYPGVYFIGVRAIEWATRQIDEFSRNVFILGERDLLCDSAWQAMPLGKTYLAGDTMRLYLTVADTAARILVGPAITDNPAGEHSFFGVLKYENGKFSVIDGNNYVEKPTRSKRYGEDVVAEAVAGGAGTYTVEFIFNGFTNPMTYTARLSHPVASYYEHVWENMGRRGYATSISSYGTWASKDHAGMVLAKLPDYGSGISIDRSRQISGTIKKSPSVKTTKKGISFTLPTVSSGRIEIFNAKGALIKRASINDKKDLSVPLQSKGLYFYRIIVDSDIVRGSVVLR